MSEANLQPMVYDDLEMIRVNVKVGANHYVLTEASGATAIRWRNAIMKAARMSSEGKVTSFVDMADTEPFLVSLCLYGVEQEGVLRLNGVGDPDPKYLVGVNTIKSWPNRVQKNLFDRVVAISDLTDKSKDTEETLTTKITELQTKLDNLRDGKDPEDTSKN